MIEVDIFETKLSCPLSYLLIKHQTDFLLLTHNLTAGKLHMT